MPGAKESAVAKSTGRQKQQDAKWKDAALLGVLKTKKKKSKAAAGYRLQTGARILESCIKCKFNLGDEKKCHVVGGRIDNERGISKFYSPKDYGMLPGDIVWEHVKDSGKKLSYQQGYVIKKGAPGFKCRDCKYYLHSRHCLLIRGKFGPEMSCGYVVKIGHGTAI